jgi:hypothetical protein
MRNGNRRDMAWTKETALHAQKKSEVTKQGNSPKLGKAELLELLTKRLRNPALSDGRFVALTNYWMMLTGRTNRVVVKNADKAVGLKVGDTNGIDALVKKLEKERQNG